MSSKFKFNKDFQVEILAMLCQDWSFLVFAADVVKPEYFVDKVLIWFYQTVVSYYRSHNKKPTSVIIRNELDKAIARKQVREEEQEAYEELYERLWLPIESKDYVKEEVIRFCKRQAVMNTFRESLPLLDSEDDDVWDNITAKITEACSVGNNATDLGVQYFVDYHERLRRKMEGDNRLIIPTGISDLDDVIGGGLRSGQLMLWMAGTGGGKSIALPHCGKRAIVSGFKVVHYTLELNEDEIADRYDASWTKFPFSELEAYQDGITKKLSHLGHKYGNSLVIKHFPTRSIGVSGLRSHLIQLINSGFVPDLIIVDYLDLLKPSTNYNDEYSDLGVIAADLRGLGGEFNVPVQSATQINRAGMAADVIEIGHVADSLKKLFVADIVAGICRNREEKDLNIARIVLPKNRNGPTNRPVKICTDYSRMSFYDVRATERLRQEESWTAFTPSQPGTDPSVASPAPHRRQPRAEAPSMPDPPKRRQPRAYQTVNFPVAGEDN